MTTRPVFLVFGHGVGGAPPTLSPVAAERVRVVTAFLADHPPAVRPLVVFSGGWPLRSAFSRVPPGASEGELMLRAAVGAGLAGHADLLAETRSRTTLDNLLCAVEDGLLGDLDFTATRPLGLVSHDWHLPRIRALARQVLRVPGRALLDVPAHGRPADRGRWVERSLRLGSRMVFLGSRDPAVLRRRELAAVKLFDRRAG